MLTIRFACLIFFLIFVDNINTASAFDIKGELTATAFMPRDFGNPFNGLFQASRTYTQSEIRVYVRDQNLTINFHGSPYTLNIRSFLNDSIFPRWSLFVQFVIVDSIDDADIVVRVIPAPTSGFGAGGMAASYPRGYPEVAGTSSSHGVIEIHPEQIEQSLNNLNEVDLSFIYYQNDADLVRMTMVYVLTHELGHTLGFLHSEKANSGCDSSPSLTTQAPLMTGNMMNFFRIQYHLNGQIPVHIDQIKPSEKELRAFRNVNDNLNEQDISPICSPLRTTELHFVSVMYALSLF